MTRSKMAPFLVAAVVALAAGQLLIAGPAVAITPVLYASPTGVDSGSCSKSAPCDLQTALVTAASGDTVLVEAGDYYKSAPLTTELGDNGRDLRIEGPAKGARPVIYSAAHEGFDLGGSSLSRVEMIYSGDFEALYAYGTVSDVAVFASSGFACVPYGLLINSLCVTTGNDYDAAVDVSAGSSGATRSTSSAMLQGDTVEALGANGVGVIADAGDSETVTVTMVNVIAHGVGFDVETSTDDLTSSRKGDLPPIALIKASHSDFATEAADTVNGPVNPSASITTTDDVKAAPRFVDAAADNFRELRSSPTVNRGAKAPAGTDLAGSPRTLGSAADIGAYEFRQHPTTEKPAVVKASATALKVADVVNGEGLPARVELVVTRHGRFVQAVKDPHAVTHAVKVRFRIHALKRGTSYQLHVVATNPVGSVRTTTITGRTTS